MKKLALLAATLGMAVSSHAQGFFSFDNSADATGAQNSFSTTIANSGAAGEGAAGLTIGSGASPNYDVGFLYTTSLALVGSSPGATDGAFIAAATEGFADGAGNSFFSTTGDDAGGAGFYGLGNATISSPATADGTHIALQIIAWYDPTGTTTFASAYSQGFNVGWSAIQNIRLASGLDTVIADTTTFNGFQVAPAVATPEPGSFALAGLGAAAMLIFRRRK